MIWQGKLVPNVRLNGQDRGGVMANVLVEILNHILRVLDRDPHGQLVRVLAEDHEGGSRLNMANMADCHPIQCVIGRLVHHDMP